MPTGTLNVFKAGMNSRYLPSHSNLCLKHKMYHVVSEKEKDNRHLYNTIYLGGIHKTKTLQHAVGGASPHAEDSIQVPSG